MGIIIIPFDKGYIMKRSTFFTITLVLICIEILYTFYNMNNLYHFVDFTIQRKYRVLSKVLYSLFIIVSLIYFVNQPEGKSFKKEHYDNVFGRKKFNIIYSYHFLIFAVVSFVASAWPWFAMGSLMFILWNWIRVKQNDYADVYELELAKENAKRKTTVTLE